MTKPARATMNGGYNIVDGKSEYFADFCIENLRYGLDFKLVIAGTKRSHFPSLSFLGAFRDVIRAGPSHLPVFLDPFEVADFAPTLLHGPTRASHQHRLHVDCIERNRAPATDAGWDLAV